MIEAATVVPLLRRYTAPRIAIVRALPGLGDLLCAVPAVRALRRSLPDASITLVGVQQGRAFAHRFDAYFDGFLTLPGFPKLWEPAGGVAALPRFLAEARACRFDIAIQMHGSGAASNALTQALGASVAAGYHPPSEPPPNPELFFPYPDDLPEIRRNLRLVERLGAQPAGEHLEFPLRHADFEELDAFSDRSGPPPGTYACIHAGAGVAARRWPPERFAQVADLLARAGLRIVLSGGPGEYSLNQTVAAAMRARSLNLASQMSAGALAALIAKARILVCNDTSVSHIAAAFGVPSVVVFTAADPGRWAPLDRRRHRAVFEPVDCRPCSWVECPIGHPCARNVTVDRVAGEALALLNLTQLNKERSSAA